MIKPFSLLLRIKRIFLIGAFLASHVLSNLLLSSKGISAKVLSTELKELELNGLVRRIVYTATRGGSKSGCQAIVILSKAFVCLAKLTV